MPRLYLLFSAAGVAGLALIYGADPATILPNLLDVVRAKPSDLC